VARPNPHPRHQPGPVTADPRPNPLDLDRVIHERVRLGIISALAANPVLTFNEVKKLFELTDGNLSVHARKLEDAGYIVCSKSFEGRTPKTEFQITPAGRKAFEKYLRHMESLILALKSST
jgi:DNA-binding MarR family transcriptional regulator